MPIRILFSVIIFIAFSALAEAQSSQGGSQNQMTAQKDAAELQSQFRLYSVLPVPAKLEVLGAPRVPGAKELSAQDQGSTKSEPINKCGQAACLCKGSFCADLIDKGYCSEFKIGGGQGLCIF